MPRYPARNLLILHELFILLLSQCEVLGPDATLTQLILERSPGGIQGCLISRSATLLAPKQKPPPFGHVPEQNP